MKHTRRSLLQLAAGTSLLPGLGSAGEVRMPPRAIDTHTHFYDLEKPGGVPWPSPKSDLFRTVMPGEFKSLTAPYHVHGTVVIEAVWPVEDNQWALDALADDPFVFGIIGRLPAKGEGGKSFADLAKRFGAHPKFKGVRIKRGEITECLSDKEAFKSLEWMTENKWTVDTLGGHAMLPDVLAIARKLPELHIVLDHLPFNVPAEKQAETERLLDELAKQPNVFAKVSNVLRKDHAERLEDVDVYRAVLDTIWKRFGSKRVIYGSNWPVSDRAGPYPALFGVMQSYLADKSPEESDAYFWGNAVRAYRLDK